MPLDLDAAYASRRPASLDEVPGSLFAVYEPCVYFSSRYALYYGRRNGFCCRFCGNGRIKPAYRFRCSRRDRFGDKGNLYGMIESDDLLFLVFAVGGKPECRFVYFCCDGRLCCLPEEIKGVGDDLNGTGIFCPDGGGRLYAVRAASAVRERLKGTESPSLRSLAAKFEKVEWAVVFDPVKHR